MKTNSFYENRHTFYGMNSGRKENILKLINPEHNKNVLDIGCGTGELAGELQKIGCQVTGVDVSSKTLEIAKRYLNDSFCFNVEGSKWPDQLTSRKFDLIVASEIIEHLFDPEDFLRKTKVLLEPNGKIIITTPNFLFWKNRLKMFFGTFNYEKEGPLDFGHIRFFTESSLIDSIERCGFEIERASNFYPNLYKRGLNFVGDLFPGLFSYQFILLIKKI